MSEGVNPLDRPGEIFDMALLNPNPSSSKTKDGPVYRVSFEIEKELWDEFMAANTKGMMIAAKATVVQGTEHEALEKPKKGPHGEYAKALKLSGFFRCPSVWKVLGTDKQFREWVQRQPSAFSGQYSEYVNGEGRCIAAHVRRAGESGTGHKAEYACIPLTNDEHQKQHQHGESALMPKGWWDQKRVEFVEQWGWERAREIFGVKSLSEVSPSAWLELAKEKGVENFLPRG